MINNFKKLDNKVKTIMINGFKFAFFICILATFLLVIYHYFYMLPILYYAGTILFKTSLMFCVEFTVLGLGFDIIKKQLV